MQYAEEKKDCIKRVSVLTGRARVDRHLLPPIKDNIFNRSCVVRHVDNDLYRASLAIACVFAVVVGASLFPATGFGANPVPAGSVANGSGSGAGTPGPGDGTATGGGSESDGSTSTSDGSTSTSDESEDTATADANQGGVGTSETTTEPATTTTEPTTTAPAGYEDSADGGLDGALLAFLTIVGTAVVFVLLTAIGLGRHHRRRYPGEWDLPSAPHLRVLEYVRRIPQTSLAFAMFAGSSAPGVVDGLVGGVRDATAGVGAATASLGKLTASLGSGLAAIPGGVLKGIGGLGRGLGSLTLGLGALTSLGSGSVLGGGSDRPSDDPRGGASERPAPPEPDPPKPPTSVREAFDRLQEDLGTSGQDGETPGEIARRAVDRGLPTDAIAALTSTFRDVRYGGYPDEGERVTVARDAYERVRAALERDSS